MYGWIGHKYMLTIKMTTLLPLLWYFGFWKNEAVLISISQYLVFSVYRPTLRSGRGFCTEVNA